MSVQTWIGLAIFSGCAAATAAATRNFALRRRVLDRFDAELQQADAEVEVDEPAESPRLFAHRHHWVAIVAAVVVCAVARGLLGLPWTFTLAFSAITGLLTAQLDVVWLAWRSDLIETQLADSIDLMISALRVGASLPAALEMAISESRAPLRPQLEEVLGRIRLGDDPVGVLAALAQRVPLETFRLFSMALAAHWSVGGSLSTTLANVGRTVRQRIEVGRRLRALTTQARVSIIAVLVVTYFIAALMWRNNPDRMVAFLSSTFGGYAAAAAMVAQAIGIVWIMAMSKPRF